MLLEPQVEALLIFRGRNELYNKGIKISIIIFKLVFFFAHPRTFHKWNQSNTRMYHDDIEQSDLRVWCHH